MTQIRAAASASALPAARPDSHLEVRARRARAVRRGAAASSITTLIAATSHSIAGGPAPAPAIVLGMIVLLILPSALLLQAPMPRRLGARRTGGLARIALTTLTAQIAFHAVFTALGGPHAGAPILASHHHSHHSPASGSSLLALNTGHAETPGMLAAHAVAALATIAILAYGEAVIRRGAGWIHRAARALAPAPALPRVPRILAAVRPRIRAARAWAPPVGLRGPPVFS